MLEHCEKYLQFGLPATVAEIPRSAVRDLPYIRFVADALCEDPSDKDKLQKTLWRLDAMATGDVADLYDSFMARLIQAK